jgi:hypothetical protein
MADGQMNIRATLDISDLERKAAKYGQAVRQMGVVTDKEGKVISTAWQRVEQAAKKANVGRVVQEMTGDVSENIAIQKKVLTDLERQYKEVAKAVENAAPGMAKNKLQSEMAAIKKEIDGEKQALTELEQVQQKYNQSNVSLRTQLLNVRNEMGQLELSGQKNSERYRELEGELGRLGTAYRKLEYEQKAFSTGATQWGGIISGIQGVAGAFTAAQGVIGMFVTDNEKLVKIQTRLQAVMAITIGMQQVSNTLHETSAFRMTTVRRITELYSAAQSRLAIALGISTVAAKALMAALTLGLSVAITGIIALISRWQSAQSKAADEQKKIVDIQKKAAESTAEQIVSFKKLQKGWNDLGDDLEKKKKYIIENKEEMDKLGIAINDVRDAENLFVIHGDDFTNAISVKAKAIASMELATERYKIALGEMVKAEEEAMNNLKKEILKRKSGEEGEAIFNSTKDLLKDKNGFEKFSQATWGRNIDFEKIFNKYQESVSKFEEEGAKVDQFLDNQSKTFKQYTDILNKSGFKTTDQAKKEEEIRKKEEEEVKKKTAQLQKQAEQEKKIQEQINNEVISLQKQNQQAQIDLMQEGTEKELAQIRLDYQEKITEIKKLADKWASEQGGTLTTEQTVQISTAYSNTKQKREQDESDVYKKQTDELNELLRQYQSYQQQRLEIETKYNNDIQKLQQQLTKSTDEEEKKRLQDSIKVAEEKKKAELSGIDLQEFQKEIDWSSVFGSLDKLSTDALKTLRDKIKEYLSTVGDSISKEDLKTVVDTFENLDAAIANRTPINELIAGYKEYKSAVDDVRKAKEALEKADNPEAKARATKELSDAEKKRAEALTKMTQSVNAIGEKGQQIVSAGNDLINMLTTLGIKIPEVITGTLEGLGQVMSGLASINLMQPFSILTGITSTLSGIGKTIGSIFGLGSDNGVNRYNALREQLEAINAIYNKIIDKSKEKIKFGEGFASVQAADEALNAYYKKLANYQKLAEEGGKAGASSGSHSYAYRVNKRLSSQWGDMSKAIGQNISSIQDMYKLSGDQLYIIQTQFPEAWRKISPEIRDNLEAIIDCKDEAKELANTLNEALTGVSFNGFYNGFIDSLADMDTSFEDMCDDFEGYLRKSIVAGLIASQYKGRIEQLYKSWAEAAESGNAITEDEAKNLRNEYQNIIKDMMKDREEMANSFGWETTQGQVKSQSGAISEAITEQTASELTGLSRGSYDTLKGIYNTNLSFHEDYKSTMSICNGILSRIADNTEQTAGNTSVLFGMNDTLNRMDGRLKNLENNSNKKYI